MMENKFKIVDWMNNRIFPDKASVALSMDGNISIASLIMKKIIRNISLLILTKKKEVKYERFFI
jgi:hypothetical protein